MKMGRERLRARPPTSRPSKRKTKQESDGGVTIAYGLPVVWRRLRMLDLRWIYKYD